MQKPVPDCKFQEYCSKPNCPFVHHKKPTKQIDCYFGNNCTNLKCIYKHPPGFSQQEKNLCHFRDKCTNPYCPFGHPERETMYQKKKKILNFNNLKIV